MSADWKPGDLALCVNTGLTPEGFAPENITVGQVYTVYAVGIDPAGRFGLFLDETEGGKESNGGFLAWRFRKINPHTPDAEDRETIELLNRKPAVVVQ